jgi:tripartite-type tricarboxylate transporter receptor subunit TctC
MKTLTVLDSPRCAGIVLLAALAVLGASPAGAQNAYPAKPIRLIVALPAGGPTDILARLIAQPLSVSLGQPIVVDNRPGAGGNIGAELVAKSPADGYTMFMGTSGPLAINPSLYKSIGFDPLRDFAPVILAASAPFVIVAHPSLAANNVKELIALAKAKPGSVNYGSVQGNASHLATELFDYMAGIKMTLVPYKGAAQATTDVIAGQIQVSFASTPGSVSLLKAGKLKALAGDERETHSRAARRADRRGVGPARLRSKRLVRRRGAGENAEGDRG